MGIWAKFGPPSRVSWVSTYEKSLAWSSGSSVTSMPGTRLPRWKATCSVSAKKLVGFAVSVSSPMGWTGRELLGHQLGRVQQVDPLERLLGVVLEGLDAQLPLGVGAGLDGVGQVATVEVRIESREELGLLPDEGVHALDRLPVELDQGRLAGLVHAPEGVHPEPLHRPVGPRDAPVGHVPDGVVLGLGVQGDEVPERVVRALCLGDLAVRMGLGRVDDIGKLDPVLDEEDGHVVADQVEGALVGVELGGEATGVPDGVRGPTGAEHRREADEDRRLLSLSQERGAH